MKTRKSVSRIMAFLLALCMFAQVMPTVTIDVASAAEPVIEKISFDKEDGVTSFKAATIASVGWQVDQATTSQRLWDNLDTDTCKLYASSSVGPHSGYTNGNFNKGESIGFAFDVAEDGYYIPVVYINMVEDFGGDFDIIVDGNKVGSVRMDPDSGVDGGTTTATRVRCEMDPISLNAGNHTLVFSCTGGLVRKYWYVGTIEFEPTDAPFEKSYSFKRTNGANLTAYDKDDNGWAWNKAETSPAVRESVVNGNSSLQEEYINANLDAVGNSIAFDFDVPKDAMYAFSANVLDVSGFGGNFDVFVDGIKLGNMQLDTGKNSEKLHYDFDNVNLSKGTHTVKFTATGGSRKYLYMYDFTLKEMGNPTPFSIEFNNKGGSVSYATATIANAGWQLDSVTTTPNRYSVLLGTTSGSLYGDVMNINCSADDVIGFKINVPVAGYYNVSAFANVVTDFGGNFDFAVDGVKLGTIIGDEGASESATASAINKEFAGSGVALSQGEHTITFTNVGGRYRRYLYLKSALFTPAREIYKYKLDFTQNPSGTTFKGDTAATLETNGWEIDKDSCTEAMYNRLDSNSNNKVFSSYFRVDYANGDVLGIRFNLPRSGNYSVDTLVWQVAQYGINGVVAIDGTVIGNITCSAADGSSTITTQRTQLSTITLSEGEHVLTIKRVGGTGGYAWFEDFTLTEVVEPKPHVIEFYNVSSFADAEMFTHGWQLDTEGTSDSVENGDTVIYPSAQQAKAQMLNKGDVLAVKIRVPFDGAYDLNFESLQLGNFGSEVNVYIDKTTYIGNIDFSHPDYKNIDSEERKDFSVKLKSVNLTCGEHTIYFKRADSYASRHNYMWLQKLTLTPVKAIPTPTEIEFKYNSSSLLKDETMEISANLGMSDGSYYLFGPNMDGSEGAEKFEIVSQTPDIVTFENGIVTAVGAGKGAIKATAVTAIGTYEKTININVTQISDGDFKLTAGSFFPVGVDKKLTTIIQGSYANVLIDLSKAESITATSADDKIALAEVFNRDGKMVIQAKGVSVGKTEITVEATYNNKTDSVVVPIEVKDSVKASVYSAQYLNMAQDTYAEMNLEEHGFAVDTEKTNPDIVDIEKRPNSTVYTGAQQMKLDMRAGESAFFKFEMDKSAHYSIGFEGVQVGNFGLTAGFYIDGEFIGDYNFSHPSEDPSGFSEEYATQFRAMYLEEGVHELEIRRINPEESRHSYMWAKALNFVPTAEPVTVAGINIDCDKDKLILGEEASAKFSVRMSDGTDYFFPVRTPDQGSFTVTDVMPERATHKDGVITAKNSGTAAFKVDANMAGSTISGYWSIPVAKGQMFDFRRDKQGTKPSVATLKDDGWAVNTAETTIAQSGSNYDLRPGGFCATFSQNGILAIDLKIEQDGAYDIDMVASQNRELGIVGDFYIDDAYLGRFDFSHPDFNEEMTDAEKNALSRELNIQLNSVQLSKGTHTLYIKRANAGTYRHDMMWLNRIVLTSADKMPEISAISISTPANEIVYKHDLKADVTVWMDNGRKWHFGTKIDGSADDANKVVFASGDENVFTVDQTGLMQGIWVGKADLIVTATVNGKATEKTQEFSTVRVLDMSSKTVFQMERLETLKGEITAILDDEAVDLTQATDFEVSAYNERIDAEIIVEDGKVYLQVTGKRSGASGVSFTAVMDGVTGVFEIPVTVFVPSEADGNVHLNFVGTGVPGSPDGAKIHIHGWEVNYDLSHPYSVNNAQWAFTSGGFKSDIKIGEKLVIDFMVKKGGNFSANFVGTQFGNFGALVDIYVDDIYMGQFNFSHPSDSSDASVSNSNVEIKLNSIPLVIGEHTLTLQRVNPHESRHSYTLWAWSHFDMLEGDLFFDHVRAEADKTTLIVGESTNIYTDAVMSDGSVRNFGPKMNGSADTRNSINITNSNPSVAKIEGNKIVAVGKGTTTVTVTAMVDGVTKTSDVTITVDDQNLASIKGEVMSPIYVNQSAEISLSAFTNENRPVDVSGLTLDITSDDTAVVAVNGTTVTGISEGEANIIVKASIGDGQPVTTTIPISVSADGLVSFSVSAMPRLIRPDSQGTQITVQGGSFQGQPIDLTGAQITYTNENPDIVSVSDSGWVTPKAIGSAKIKVKVVKGSFTDEGEITIVVTNGKVGRSYYTDDKIANARENIGIYDWAKKEKNSAVAVADQMLEIGVEQLYDWITTQELPRCYPVGFRYDPEQGVCRYCGVDIGVKYGNVNSWIYGYTNGNYWKVQCPDCRRKFPSNDFWSFYKLGIDDNGNWSYQKSHEENQKLVDAGHKGYLVNVLYPEVASVKTLNGGRGLSPKTETVEGWGVDDGYGYRTGYIYKNTSKGDIIESHTYIAAYNRQHVGTFISDGFTKAGLAYMYTGDEKYGRLAAILLDRIADVYPDMKIVPYFPEFANSDSTSPYGKFEGCIWETGRLSNWASTYDAIFPMYDDPYVIKFLSGKAKEYNMANDKSTPELIRQNVEDGVLRQIYIGNVDGDIYGNFGMHQYPLALAARVLDTMPETKEWLDFVMAKDEKGWHQSDHTGGDVLDRLLNGVDRDGGTQEGMAPNYANLWYNSVGNIADAVEGYERYAAADIFKHPKYQKMLENQIKQVFCRRQTIQIGDSGATASLTTILPYYLRVQQGYNATKNITLAQSLYYWNGNSVNGLNNGIWAKDPEKIQREITQIIDEHGEYPFDDSNMMAGYGFASLRDGSLYGAGTLQEKDTQRDFWMQFGITSGHGHPDALNMGLHAYGLDFAPDLGYPTAADGADEYVNWGHSTVNHNTVMINDKTQSTIGNPGAPLHYEDVGFVKLIDAEVPAAYKEAEEYRRTLIMINVNDDISYGVDLFRVKGGDEHLYTFHSQSDNIGDYEGFKLEEQGSGSYAGENVPYKTFGYKNGFTYLKDVRRDTEPKAKEFFVDFDVTDYRKAIKDNKDLHLRLTMLNDFEMSEIAFARGDNPYRDLNPETFTYLLARRSGENLDTTFTTVFEPYKGERYIKNMSQLKVERADGKPVNTDGDVVRAIKVELENGRDDYIFYASNNRVEYKIIDSHDVVDEATGETSTVTVREVAFEGFAGVLSYEGDNLLYSYLSDGVKLGELEAKREYTGSIVEFTRFVTADNEIIVSFDEQITQKDMDAIKGRWMYVENDEVSNGAYEIQDVVDLENGTYSIKLGNTTLIRSATNVTAETGDYKYNIAPRQWFNIPLSAIDDNAPEFSYDPGNADIAVGKEYTLIVNAYSPIGKTITYEAVTLPRGASFDPETATLSWKPDSYQVGDNHIAIRATDGTLENVLHIDARVFKASSGSGSLSDGNESVTPSTPSAPSGGGSAGGGGGSTTPSTPSTPTTPETPDEPTTPDAPATGEGEGAGDAPETPAEKFVDLGNHTWAEDAIYTLVDKGVVNGTSANTYAPANNIKRADFAIMLVRAFGITEGEGENFADVSANKYYAEELRLAKAAGIVNGVGNDKFNPEGEITRQDMMLMLSRALDAMEVELSDADLSALADFADAAQISDYAADAVSRMIKDGIIAGSNGKINPLAKATRAEIAVMLDRVLAK